MPHYRCWLQVAVLMIALVPSMTLRMMGLTLYGVGILSVLQSVLSFTLSSTFTIWPGNQYCVY